MTLIPMPGRDYTSKDEVLTAFLRGDTFRRQHDTLSVTVRTIGAVKTVHVQYAQFSRVAELVQDDVGNWSVQ